MPRSDSNPRSKANSRSSSGRDSSSSSYSSDSSSYSSSGESNLNKRKREKHTTTEKKEEKKIQVEIKPVQYKTQKNTSKSPDRNYNSNRSKNHHYRKISRSRSRNRKRDRHIEKDKKTSNHKSYSKDNKRYSPKIEKSIVREEPLKKPKVKGRGSVRKDDDRALLGWDDEDYLKANKRLSDYGQKYKNIIYRNNNKNIEAYKIGPKKEGKGWRHDKYNRTDEKETRGSPKYEMD